MKYLKGFRRKKETGKERLVRERGAILLQELIAECDGKCNPICVFSADQILQATNHFAQNSIISDRDNYKLYEGIMEDRPVMVKTLPGFKYGPDFAFRDIVVSAQMSSHRNALMLLGCCFELPDVVLVFERAENGVLDSGGCLGRDGTSLPWNIRLKISKEIANAVTYLHTSFPRIVVHRDIKPANVFLDEKLKAKLSGFLLSISIPEGKTSIEADTISGTLGFIQPEYMQTCRVTEKVDVYAFGVFMLVLLTGKSTYGFHQCGFSTLPDYVIHLVEDKEFFDIIDPILWGDMGKAVEQKQYQMEVFLELSLRCIGHRGQDIPKMIEVAKELKRIEKLMAPSCDPI